MEAPDVAEAGGFGHPDARDGPARGGGRSPPLRVGCVAGLRAGPNRHDFTGKKWHRIRKMEMFTR